MPGPAIRPSSAACCGWARRADRLLHRILMEWARGRDALVALAVALLAGTVAVLPPFELLHGWSIDALTALRWQVFGNRYEPFLSPTVVIGLADGKPVPALAVELAARALGV